MTSWQSKESIYLHYLSSKIRFPSLSMFAEDIFFPFNLKIYITSTLYHKYNWDDQTTQLWKSETGINSKKIFRSNINKSLQEIMELLSTHLQWHIDGTILTEYVIFVHFVSKTWTEQLFHLKIERYLTFLSIRVDWLRAQNKGWIHRPIFVHIMNRSGRISLQILGRKEGAKINRNFVQFCGRKDKKFDKFFIARNFFVCSSKTEEIGKHLSS